MGPASQRLVEVKTMEIPMLSPESIARVLVAGGNVRISTLSLESLLPLAATTRQHKVRLEIVGTMSPDAMVQIAAAGGGYVFFDISKK
jgi:hypothetical protein